MHISVCLSGPAERSWKEARHMWPMPACSSNNGADTAMKQRISCLPAFLASRSFICMYNGIIGITCALGLDDASGWIEQGRGRGELSFKESGEIHGPDSTGFHLPSEIFSFFLENKSISAACRLCCWSQALNNWSSLSWR